MSTPTFDPEDSKLTAYALGELHDPIERAEVETLLQHNPQARAAVQEIKDLTLVLTAEYDQERRAALEPANPLTPNIIALASHLPAERRTWVRSLLAAAAMLLAIGALASLVSRFSGDQGGRSPIQAANSAPQGKATVTEIEPAPLLRQDEQKPVASTAEANQPLFNPTDSIEETDAKLAAARIKLRELDGKLLVYRKKQPSIRVDAAGSTNQVEADSLLKAGTQKDLEAAPALVAPDLAKSQPGSTSASSDQKDTSKVGQPVILGMGQPGLTQPSNGEYQRYAGHPATTPLGPVIGYLRGQTTVTRGKNEPEAAPAAATLAAPAAAPAGAVAALPTLALAQDKSRARDLQTAELDSLREEKPKRASAMAGFAYRTTATPNTAVYEHLEENPFLGAKENPLSTFSIDVDTASYANVRRFIESGSLPPPDAVRIEELLNYFPYDYAPPAADSDKPFAVHLEAASCPWMPEHRLVRIGLKGREIAQDKRPPSNLVFLIDVSGSMDSPERLPLIKRAMSMMVEHLTATDHVAIVTYAGNSGLALPATSGEHKDLILGALDRLEAGGSTNGASGITLAYQVAKEGFIKGGTNRVILATDGDFNVGVTDQGDLVRLIQDEAKSGVFLSALGVGTDNYKDVTMQKLADKGNGNYHYIDRIEEARKVLVDQMGGTLVAIAKDVKIQVEFNPAVVAAYRLIGYEKRTLRKEDFNDDRVDAGEIGAGHSVTALYEVVPVGQPPPGESPAVDALRYAAKAMAAPTMVSEPVKLETAAVPSAEMLTVKLRHKAPDADRSERTDEVPLTDKEGAGPFAKASGDFKFAAAVASFGLVLRDSPYKGNARLGAAVEMAQEGKGNDAKGYRAGFIELARRAAALKEER